MIGVAQLWSGPRGGRQIRWAAPPRKQIKNSELGEYDVKPIELHAISDETFPGTFLIRPELFQEGVFI